MIHIDPAQALFIVDGSSFLYRAYYGSRPLHTLKGEPVQAVYSFVRMMKKLMDTHKTENMALVWDSKGKTTRHEMYQDYKATRQAPPSDLFTQKEHIVKFADLIGLRQIAKPGIEADDIMYSLAREQTSRGKMAVMITGDKDMAQTLGPAVIWYDPLKGEYLDAAAYEAKYGIAVDKIPFYYALLGDTSDNIPGVKGVGEKSAQQLVKQFANLDDLYAHIDSITPARIQTALKNNKENAYLSYKLFLLQYHATGLQDTDLKFDRGQWAQAAPLFAELNFNSLLKDIQAQHTQQTGVNPEIAARMAQYEYVAITTVEQLEQLVALLQKNKFWAVDTESDGLDPHSSLCVGLSVCVQEGKAYYVPFAHATGQEQVSKEIIQQKLGPLFADPAYGKIFHNAKYDLTVLHHAGFPVNGLLFDTMLAAHLVTKEWQRVGLKTLSQYYLQEPMLSFAQVVTDAGYKTFAQVPIEHATAYAASDAHQTFRLYHLLKRELEEHGLWKLYHDIDLPLIHTLLAMELEGITCHAQQLKELEIRISNDMDGLYKQLIELIGPQYNEINLLSPKQVEQLLFVDLQLPPGKKSAKRTGYSTDAEVLASLSSLSLVPSLILQYRELSKLRGTYAQALPNYINEKSGKIHTSFSQIAVATGRLASSDPNLQNIPAEGTYGMEIRAAFVPPAGHVFISADYSQIELRVLAHITQDAALLDAFVQGRDIHTETAARIFGIDPVFVIPAQRQVGKRINFSIIYGLTPYGLSQDLHIPLSEAKKYIDRYFEQYPKLRIWMDSVIIDAKQIGYVTTLWGRRRYVPALHEKNRTLYQEAVRVAINSVVQGTAADLMKMGMIQLEKAWQARGINACIILQIHDELLISAPIEQKDLALAITQEILSNVVQWTVPFSVTTRVGNTWKDVSK